MSRTKKQTDASMMDLRMFNLIAELDDFIASSRTKQEWIDAAASALRMARHAVRDRMHPDDVRDTI